MENLLVIISVLFTFFVFSLEKQLLIRARNNHLPEEQSNEQVEYLAKLSNITQIQQLFDNLLVPRVVGTPSHEKVYKFIIKELEKLDWTIDVDEFQDATPNFGTLTFKNIVATLNPDANRFLTLACHYDSKYFQDNDFIGATDSAVPCAMMLNLASVMKNELDKLKSQSDLGLKLIFFDGEEAFVQWGPNDSIYGAKHLAEKLNQNLRLTSDGETVTDLTRIDVLVLLDLIGVSNPKFYCFFEETQRWYERLSDAEDRLANLGLLKSYETNNPNQIYFNRRTSFSFVEDDHIPFLRRRVPVLHLIPSPFPKEWHTPADNRDIIDIDTVENLNKILRVFVAEYLRLSVLQGPTKNKNYQVEL